MTYIFSVLDDDLNVYTEISDYIKLRKSKKSKSLRFFLQTTRRSDVEKLKLIEFFGDQTIIKNIFKYLVKKIALQKVCV